MLFDGIVAHREVFNLGEECLPNHSATFTIVEETLSDRSIAVNLYVEVMGGDDLVYYALDSVDAKEKMAALKAALSHFTAA